VTVAAATSLVALVVIMQPQAAPPFHRLPQPALGFGASIWQCPALCRANCNYWTRRACGAPVIPRATTPSTDSVRIDSVGEGLDSVGTATTT